MIEAFYACCSVEFLKAAPAEREVLLLDRVLVHRSCTLRVLTATWRSAQARLELAFDPGLHRLMYVSLGTDTLALSDNTTGCSALSDIFTLSLFAVLMTLPWNY